MKTVAIIVARLIFAFAFAQAAAFKFLFVGIAATAEQIAAVGFPFPTLLAWIAAFFEVALAIAFLTGLLFRKAALTAAAYVLLLGFLFYGPGKWSADLMAYGMFINHLVFIAGLFFAAVHGPGNTLILRRKSWPTKS